MTKVLDRIRNGVDSEQMYGTLDAIKAEKPDLGIFQFRARNHWIDGAHNRSTIRGFGAGQEDATRSESFVIDAGEPAILLGSDTGANPAEHLLHALAACLTTSLVYVAAARGVRLTEVESSLEGDMDVRGCLGLSDEVRNGFNRIRVSFRARGRAGGEAARGRRARPSAVRSVRHGQSRRAGRSRRRHRLIRVFDLNARTEPGAHLVRLAESLSEELAATAGLHDRPGVVPPPGHRPPQGRALLHGPDPRRARRAGRRVGPRPRRRLEPAGAR